MTEEPVRCVGCGRQLRDAVSRARRYGPTCLRRLRPATAPAVPLPTPPAFPCRWRGRLVEDVPLPMFDQLDLTNPS